MNRWNALRPENEVEKPNIRGSGRNHDQNSICTEQKINNSRGFRGIQRNSSRTNFDERKSLLSLETLLQSYEERLHEESFIIPGVIETLKSYEKFLLTSKVRTVDSEFLVVLCKLFRVDDNEVVCTIERLVELLLEEGCKIQSVKEVALCIDQLKKSCYRFPSDFKIRRLLFTVVADSGYVLPAEELAQYVVAPLILPVLESANSNRLLFTKACKAISAVILNQGHKSAILAPLLNDISPDGREEFVANPIRQRLSSALERHLIERNGRTSWRDSACCHLLADIVNSSIKIDRSLSPVVQCSINLLQTREFFLESLCAANQAVCVPAMFLLRSLLRYELQLRNGSISQPMLDMLSRMIFDPERSKRERVDYFYSLAEHGFMYGNLLSLAHASWINYGKDVESGKIIVECLSEIVSALPWERWMHYDKPTGTVSESGFSRRTVNFLRGLMNVAHCAVSGCDEKTIGTTSYLVQSYFYATKAEHHELSQSSTKLWSAVAETSLSHPSERVRQGLVRVLVESCGGQIMPNGKTTMMYEPAKRWLASQASKPFLDSLFVTVERFASCPSHPSINLLSAILRSLPNIASSNSWNRCSSLFSSVNDIDVNVGSLVIFDAVVCGRSKNCEDSSSIESIKGVVCKTLSISFGSSFVKIRCLGLSLFGLLSAKDWAQMCLENEQINLLLHSALSLCKDENQTVRSSACKAIGQFCTQYILGMNSSSGHIKSIVDRICCCMNVALRDEKPRVRSMAMFAIGNIAHTLCTNLKGCLQSNMLVEWCKIVQVAMNDSSEKVVVNSIRAAGHWGHLLAREEMRDEAEILSCLISELLDVLVISVETLSNETDLLTWKKRGALMKYGSGVACTRAIHQLVTCIEQYWSLSLKLTFSAITALGKLSRNNLSQICTGSGILGAAIATFTYRLNENHCTSIRTLSIKQERETDICLKYLLAAASLLDASATLEKDYFSQATLAFLYSWMVKNELDGSVFAIFAIGLRRFEFKFADVSLEQSFISRSFHHNTGIEEPISLIFDDGSEL